MSFPPKAPTVATIAEDLTPAMDLGGWFGYAYDEFTDALIIEQYDDDWQIVKTYTATIIIKENN